MKHLVILQRTLWAPFLACLFLFSIHSSAKTPKDLPKDFDHELYLRKAIRYIHKIATQPHFLNKKPQTDLIRYSLAVALHSSEPEIIHMLKDQLENLTYHPASFDCHFFIAAYLSDDIELQNKAVELLTATLYGRNSNYYSIWKDGIKTPEDRFFYFLSQFNYVLSASPSSAPFLATQIGELLSKVPFKFNKNEERLLAYLNPHTYANDVSKIITISFLKQFLGSAKFNSLQENNLKKYFEESFQKITTEIKSNTNSSIDTTNLYQDAELILNHAQHPTVVSFLNENIEKIFLLFPKHDSIEKMILAAWTSNNSGLTSKAVQLLQNFIDTPSLTQIELDAPTLNRIESIMRNQSLYRNFYGGEEAYINTTLDQESRKMEQNRTIQLKKYEDRIAYIFHVIFSVTNNSELINSTADLLTQLSIDEKSILKKIKYLAYKTQTDQTQNNRDIINQFKYQLAKEYLSKKRGDKYLEKIFKEMREYEEASAIELIKKQINSSESTPFQNDEHNAIYSTIFKLYKDPRIISLLKLGLSSLWSNCLNSTLQRYRSFYLVLAYASGDLELQNLAHNLLYSDLEGTSACNPLNLNNQNPMYIQTGALYDLRGFSRSWSYLVKNTHPDIFNAYENLFSDLEKKHFQQDQTCRSSDQETQTTCIYFNNIKKIITHLLLSGSLPSQDLNTFEATITELLSYLNDQTKISDYLLEILEQVSTLKESKYQRSIYLAILASGNIKLIEKLKNIISKKIRGEDARFNQTAGIQLKNEADRFKFLFYEFLMAVYQDSSSELSKDKRAVFLPAIIQFLAHLDIEYSNEILIFLYSLEHNLGQSFIGISAKKIIQMVNKKKNYHIYINGGYSETSNIVSHEIDLKSFNEHLFGKNAILMNAAGKLEGSVTHLPADLPNFKNLIADLAEKKPTNLTFVFGGHGNQLGFTLWNLQFLTAQELSKLYSQIPSPATIKSLFLQCFGGTMVVDPNRRIPRFLSQLKRHLNYYYKKNRCALAMSSQDQLGQYYSGDGNWDTNFWMKTFDYNPLVSLRELKETAFATYQVKSTPISTSDYFVSDVIRTLCSEVNWIKNEKNKTEFDLKASTLNTTEWAHLIDKISTQCQKISAHTVFELRNKNMTFFNRTYLKSDQILVALNDLVIQNFFPDFFNNKDNLSTNPEETAERYIAEGKSYGLSKEKLTQILKALSTLYPYHAVLASELKASSEIRKYYDDRFKALYPNFQEEIKDLININSLDNQTENTLIAKIRNLILQTNEISEANRKTQENDFSKIQREFIEPILAEVPWFSEINELYQSIKACEEMPLAE